MGLDLSTRDKTWPRSDGPWAFSEISVRRSHNTPARPKKAQQIGRQNNAKQSLCRSTQRTLLTCEVHASKFEQSKHAAPRPRQPRRAFSIRRYDHGPTWPRPNLTPGSTSHHTWHSALALHLSSNPGKNGLDTEEHAPSVICMYGKPHGFVVENAEPACISNRWRSSAASSSSSMSCQRKRWRGVTQARI
jgi:hypothetical protein